MSSVDGPYHRWRRASEVPGLTPVQKGILLAIALHADKNRVCFPKVETLAEFASCSERAARDAVKHLAAAGLIGLARKDGWTTTYTLLMDRWPRRAAKEGVQPLQWCSDCTPDESAPLQSLQGRGAAIAGVGVQPLHLRGAAIAPEVSIEGATRKEPTEGAKGEAPVQTIRGPQATVVIPAEPVVESPLLSLLASSGMAMGEAGAVARKLLEKGITSLDCQEIAALDEFDIGRIVGAQKGRVVAAFRRAGWLPPKERHSPKMSALPPGMKIIDEKGNPVGAVPSTKAEKKAVETDDWFAALRNSVQKEEVTLGE